MSKKYRKARDILLNIGLTYTHRELKAVFKEEAVEKHIDANYLDTKDDDDD
jgi:hypothetical protein